MAFRKDQRITADIVPMEIAEEEDDDFIQPVANLKRNLLGDFSRPSILEPPVQHEHMKVYLRVRPFTDNEIDKKENQECLSVLTNSTVSTNPPKDSHFFKNMSRGSCKTTTRYTFSQIFSEDTTQKDFFSSTMLGLVKDFIDGQNCLVFSYGVTSSGKTYTIQGNPRDAGVLPRALDVIFNSISKQQWDGMDLKPNMFMDVTRLSPDQEMFERKLKERVLKLSCDDDMDVMSLLGDETSDISIATNTTTSSESSNMSHIDGKDSIDTTDSLFDELATRVREEGKVSVDEQGQVRFSIWVTFAEIYNEQIYDLLETMPKKKNSRRPCLKLSEDKSGSPYIKGLKHIQVSSADEAYKLLTIGQRNLQTACTKLNHNSSRSHCIFNIKILRVMDKDNPHIARVSMLTLCDLAGSERYGKTKASGERLKEAGNINTSLLTLGRCIETLRYNQTHKDNVKIVPFRESKLTRLFQNFFVGRGKAAMIVNVNQLASMFDETMHVFKFSALASKVEVHQKPVFIKPKLPVKSTPANMPRASISWATPARNHNLKQREAQNAPLPEEDDDLEDDTEEEGTTYTQENIDELLGVIEQLQSDLENEIHTKFKMEKQIRKEVCDEMMKQFSEIEEQCSERIRLREQWAEELAEKRIQLVLKAERAKHKDVVNDDDDEWVSSVLLHQEKVKVEKKEEIIQTMQKEIEDLKTKVESLEEDNDTQLDSMNKKVTCYEEKIQSLEDELAKKQSTEDNSNKADLVENLTQQLQQTRQHIKEQEKEVKELNDMLTEAGETFETKQSEIDKLKELTQEYEKRMEELAETIKVLERAATDSKVAMETADASLSKREDCVSTLQQDIRDLEADVNKYRNKARFFEEQIVEKEQEANKWKTKYERDIDDHAKSQEALIHGFNAEISNLKSQIFHFKSQLYGVKSPVKSPGGTLRTPDAKMKLFPMSPLSTPSKEVGLNCSMGSNSPAKETIKHTVNEQVKALQGEMDKNCKMISELEHALQLSKACTEDHEKRLAAETQKCKELEDKLHLAEELSNKCTCSKSDSGCGVVPEIMQGSETNEMEAKLKEKDAEIKDLNVKVKELEPLMKDYFSTAKKLTDSEKQVKELQELLEENAAKVTDYESKIKHMGCDITDLKKQLTEKEDSFKKLEEKIEEVETLNSELKDVVDKTAFDLLAKDSELQILSPKLEKMQKISEDEHQSVESLTTELKTKVKENKEMKETLSKLKLAYQVKSSSLQEVTEKCSQQEFDCEELQITNQDLQQKAKENSIVIEDLKYQLEKHETEIKTTGEELAVINVDAEKYKRMIEELKVNVTDLESAVADKEVELCDKDKIIADKNDEINKMKSMTDNNDGEKNELTQKLNKFASENDILKTNLIEIETKLAHLEKDHASKCEENEEKYQASMTELTNQKEKLEDDLKKAHEDIVSIKEEVSCNEETNGKLVLLESELKNKSEELHCAEKIVAELKVVLKRRDEQLEELHNNLRNSHKNGEKSGREIRKKDEQISILQTSLEENVKRIEGLQSQLAKVQLLLAEKDLDLTTLKGGMIAENSSVIKLNDEMKEISREHESKKKELNNKLEKSVQEIEILKQELADIKLLNSQNENALKVKVSENEAFRKEVEEDKPSKEQTDNKLKELQNKVIDLNETNNDLKQRIADMNQSKQDDDLKSEVEILKKENKNLENEITAWKEAADRRDTALQEQIEKIKDIEKRNKDLEQEVLNEKEVKEGDSSAKSELSMKEVECETLKLELKVLKEQINDTNETSCLSPQTGVRKLRKNKIEIENSLIEARFKISSYESKIKELETKLLNAENTKETTPINDSLLQQKLNTLTSKLQESETMNMSLLKEVSQLQCRVDKLEADLKEEQDRAVPVERDIHRRSRASMLQAELRQSISSPSSKMELTKSREREHELKEQLGSANTMIQDWLTKLTETENKLSVKTQELKHAKETIEALEIKMAQSGCKIDQQLQEYMDKNNELKLQVLKKEGELECCTRTVQNLQRQLDTESGLLKSFEKEKTSQDQFVTLLKDTLEEQENMLQVQTDYIEEKETALKQSQSDHKLLLEKYQSILEKQESGLNNEKQVERDVLKQQLTEANTDKMKLLEDLKEKKLHVSDVEKKLKKSLEEKDKLSSVIKENNQELKAMECSLTEALKKIEDLKSQGSDKYSDIKLEEMKREAEKATHDLQSKIRTLQCQKKELEFKLSAHVEKVGGLNGEKHVMEQKLQEFREERDKLVSGLEAVLKKKDTEIKQHREIIKQLKEKEIQLTKTWHDEREQIAAGLQDLNQNAFHVKEEPSMSSSVKEEPVYATVECASKMRSPTRSCSKPPRPSPPKVPQPSPTKVQFSSNDQQSDLEIQPLNQSPGCGRRGIRSPEDTSTPAKPSEETGSVRVRRRGKKRQSDEGLEDLPPVPKRHSKDRLSNMSESDDYTSHLQVDATPPVAAKTLRRTRKKNGSQIDLTKADDSENQPRRSTRNKRNAKHRLLESFRESPMGKTGKRLLDSIAETFSPKSPTRSPVRSPLREDNSGSQLCTQNSDSRENVTCENEGTEKKSGRGRGRHKLYKEETYISEPFENMGEFVQSQDENIHKTVTRSLRSRRHQNN